MLILLSLFEIKSAPVLTLGLSCLQIFRMSISEILEFSNKTGLLSGRKVLKSIFEFPISDASFGPIPAKKLLNPFAISKYSEIISPLSLKKSGI